jgi:hypothetical protein
MKSFQAGVLLFWLMFLLTACTQSQGAEVAETAVLDTPQPATEVAAATPTDLPPTEALPTVAATEPPELIAVETAVPTELPAPTRTPNPELVAKYADYELITLLPPDAIPAIDNPSFLTAAQAEVVYDSNELVIGVAFNGEARAYSVPLLSNHEIVNDEIGGVKIAVTW